MCGNKRSSLVGLKPQLLFLSLVSHSLYGQAVDTQTVMVLLYIYSTGIWWIAEYTQYWHLVDCCIYIYSTRIWWIVVYIYSTRIWWIAVYTQY